MKLKYDKETGSFDSFKINCLGGGGGGTTTTKPSAAQEAILRQQLSLANRVGAAGELDFFPGGTLAEESPVTRAGQNLQFTGARDLLGLGPDITGAVRSGLSTDLVSDPRTEALAEAVTRPLEQQFFERTLPGITSAAEAQGAFGGSRADILKSTAARDFATSVGDTRAKVFADAQRAGLSQQLGILGLLPQVQQGILAPSQAVLDIGAQKEERSQAEIDAARERFEFEEFSLTDLANRQNALLSGINFGTTTRTSGGGK